VGELLDRRRSQTDKRIQELRAELQDAEKLVGDRACVYMTGSFGRGEAGENSDLDVFIAAREDQNGPLLQNLDETLVKADLIKATRTLHIPEFSGQGEYLQHYSVSQLVKSLGTSEDDAKNTFTARLLLLLESRCLLGQKAYEHVIEQTITAYWRDYADREHEFVPGYLANDILRLWRTFCVNYEARSFTDPPEEKAKRKLKNYKLKHSRLLTCYSSLLYLLAVYSAKNTVNREDAAAMVHLAPTERLEWILKQGHCASSHAKIAELLKSYETFLRSTDESKKKLLDRFSDREQSLALFKSAKEFGDLVFDILESIGSKNRFYRVLVV
jgi:predicted nucleotidyltransferase